MHGRFRLNQSGFTMIEVLMVVTLLSLLAIGGIAVMINSADEDRYDETMARLTRLKHGLVGNPEQVQGGLRSNFGYLGDVGALPSPTAGLAALRARPTGVVTWAVDANSRLGMGWNGPYAEEADMRDGWGRNWQYSLDAGGNAAITSLGADGLAGGTGLNQDVTLSIPSTSQRATLYGFAMNGRSTHTGAAQVEIFYPNGSGSPTSTLVSVVVSSNGSFQAANIPFGPRSLKIYAPSRAAATTTRGPNLISVDRTHYLLNLLATDLNP